MFKYLGKIFRRLPQNREPSTAYNDAESLSYDEDDETTPPTTLTQGSKLVTRRYRLGKEELVSVVVTSYHKPIHERPNHRWEYFEFDPPDQFRGKHYADLFSEQYLDLYPGEFALVVGHEVEVFDGRVRYLYIDEVRGEKRFVIREGDRLRVADAAIKTNTPNATYFNWATVELNGWKVNLKVPTLAFGKVVEPFKDSVVRVKSIVRPKERPNRDGYLLYAEFVDQ